MKTTICITAILAILSAGEALPAAPLAPGEREIPQAQGTRVNPSGDEILVTTKCLRINGEPVVGTMGEMHFSRVPQEEWRDYIRKMKDGGIGMLATYVFWIHHEETEGEFDFTGRRDISAFLKVCEEEKMPVVLRIGPWAHGECRNGGFPDWLCARGCKLRSRDSGYMACVRTWWTRLAREVVPHLWKNGGMVVGIQIENESRGPWAYLQALKDLAREIGFDVPFYTRTGWPAMRDTPAYGELLPLFGDYVDGHWGRGDEMSPGPFARIWKFTSQRSSENIATELLPASVLGKDERAVAEYPFLTCELGGGMSYAYHRRVEVFPMDTYALALLKLGCGSNLIGYYMYASGTNPADGKTYLAESQTSPYTNGNDLPPLSYEYQSPISEYGRLSPTWHLLRPLHAFCRNFGAEFALCEPEFFGENESRRGPFRFHSDYNRVTNRDTIPYIFPENWKTRLGIIKSATAQPVEWRGDTLVMMKIPGFEPKVEFDGEAFNVEFIDFPDYAGKDDREGRTIAFAKTKEPGAIREVKQAERIERGKNNGVAMQPAESDWADAAVYELAIPEAEQGGLLEIDWTGDVARLYVDEKPVADQFFSGKKFVCGLWRHDLKDKRVTFRVLPWGDSPLVYVQAPHRPTAKGEAVRSVATMQPLR